MLSLFSKEMLACYIKCFSKCLVVNFRVCPPAPRPLPPPHPRDPACPFVSSTFYTFFITYQSGIPGQVGEQGQPSEK